MSGPVILNAEKRWECPSCHLQDVTYQAQPHTRMHACRALKGIVAPMVEVATLEFVKHSVRHVVREREDYVGNEQVRLDGEGRPVMAVVTERADGSNDCHVFAGVAQGFDAR